MAAAKQCELPPGRQCQNAFCIENAVSLQRWRHTKREIERESKQERETERERKGFNCQQVGEIEIVPKYNEMFSIYLGLKVVNNF